MRRVLVSAFLADSIQQIHSLRAIDEMCSQVFEEQTSAIFDLILTEVGFVRFRAQHPRSRPEQVHTSTTDSRFAEKAVIADRVAGRLPMPCGEIRC